MNAGTYSIDLKVYLPTTYVYRYMVFLLLQNISQTSLPCGLLALSTSHTLCTNHMLIYTECVHFTDKFIPIQQSDHSYCYHFSCILEFGSLNTLFINYNNIQHNFTSEYCFIEQRNKIMSFEPEITQILSCL
jgi:hypothetical protein